MARKQTSTIRTYQTDEHVLTPDEVKDAILCYIERLAIMRVAVGEGDVEFFQECNEDETVQSVRVRLARVVGGSR